MDLTHHIRKILDYPKPGIVFRDISTLLSHPKAFAYAIEAMSSSFSEDSFDTIAGIESRGFILGAPLAFHTKKPFIPIRKKGKLPGSVFRVSYQLEYGEDSLEIHQDGIEPGMRVLIVDDLIATGGTIMAARDLVLMQKGSSVAGVTALIDLPHLGGSGRLEALGVPVRALLKY